MPSKIKQQISKAKYFALHGDHKNAHAIYAVNHVAVSTHWKQTRLQSDFTELLD